jgi:hypothetical protein
VFHSPVTSTLSPPEWKAKRRQSRLVSPFRHANVTIRNLTLPALRIIEMFNYERHYSEKGNQTGTEANIDNTPAVRRIGASICAREQLPICH